MPAASAFAGPAWLGLVLLGVAFAAFTVAVWAERLGGGLRAWHTVLLWLALVATALGIGLGHPAGETPLPTDLPGALRLVVLIVPFFHASWAAAVRRQQQEAMATAYRRLAVFVWAGWAVVLAAVLYGDLAARAGGPA
jgi:uncharacterized repeat protein (TIGR03987 family)